MQQYLQTLLEEDPEGFQDTVRALNINPAEYNIDYSEKEKEEFQYCKLPEYSKGIQSLKKQFIQETFLENTDSEDHKKIEEIAQLEETVQREVLAVKTNNKPVGAIWFIPNYNDNQHGLNEDYTYIDKVFVKPEYRGMGLATSLVKQVEKLSKRVVADANYASEPVFRNRNFQQGGYFRSFSQDFRTMIKWE